MNRNVVLAFGLAALLGPAAAAEGRADDKVVTVKLRNDRAFTAEASSKLSAALLATKDSGGVLKGADDKGSVVISLPEANMPRLTASRAVSNVVEQWPENWTAVKLLKVTYKDGQKPTAEALDGMGLKLIEDYAKGSFLVVAPKNDKIDAALARALSENPSIRFATPSIPMQAVRPTKNRKATPPRPNPRSSLAAGMPNDKLFPRLWGMTNIRAHKAWLKEVNKSPDIIVAVIDTGVDYEHADLKNNMWKNANGKHGFDFVQNDDDPMDGDSHGTHCAGTIGAAMDRSGVVGVTWEVKIMACRWLDDTGRGNIIAAIKCIDFAVENGAQILSNSWFWPEDDPDLEAAIKRANDKGVLFIAAAGNFRDLGGNNEGNNDNATTLGRFPSCYTQPNIIAVAAIDENDKLADFSNWGKRKVHLGAPGVGVISCVKRGQGVESIDPSADYDAFSGTSMATPHVAGAAALTLAHARQANSRTLATEIRKLLLDNARKVDDLKERCSTEGVLDLTFLGTTGGPQR